MDSKVKEIQFQKWATIHFDDPSDIPSPWNKKRRLTVMQDRYRKSIREREIQRKEANLGKSALAGAALGGLIHPSLKGVAVGAAGGLTTQTAALLHGRTTRDPYGEESISSKRIERIPYQAGGLAALGLVGHKLYKGARKARLFSNPLRIIQFQFTPAEDKSTPWHVREAQRWLSIPGAGWKTPKSG